MTENTLEAPLAGSSWRFTARDLNDIADAFELYASDQIAAKRWQTTKRDKAACDLRAVVWRDAAQILRNTTLTGAA